MSKKACGLMLAVGLVFWTAAEAEEWGRETLRGLKGVAVTVEKMKPDAERDGLTRSQLQTDVELRLRKAGIPVLEQEEQWATPGNALLYINVGTIQTDDLRGLYAFAIHVSLLQGVALERNSTMKGLAATWFPPDDVGTVGKDNLREYLRKAVADDIDAFINAYLAVNPR